MPAASRPACSRCSTTGTSCRRSSRTWRRRSTTARRAMRSPSNRACMAPLPRAYQWADGSAFINHVELVRRARNAEMPASFWTDPLMYQGGSDDFLGPCDDIVAASEDWGIDFEAEVAVVTGDVAMGTAAEAALDGDAPADARQRRQPAQPDPGRAGQGLRLLPEQAGDRLQPGRGDARRARRRLARRPPAPRPRKHLERRARRACATPAPR